jgi:DinB superfamily
MNVSLARIAQEGLAEQAWHGPSLKQAIAGVDNELALWRPAAGWHNIAEIALHHAFYVHSVRGRIGDGAGPFVAAEEWVVLPNPSGPSWTEVGLELAQQQRNLEALLEEIAARRRPAVKPEQEVFESILGITCHAVYHAGQIQLIRKLAAGRARSKAG